MGNTCVIMGFTVKINLFKILGRATLNHLVLTRGILLRKSSVFYWFDEAEPPVRYKGIYNEKKTNPRFMVFIRGKNGISKPHSAFHK